MATLSTATTNFSTLVQAVIVKAAEQELRASLVHTMPGNYQSSSFIPGTNLVRLGRYADPSAQTVALTEGTPPTAQALTIGTESFSATQVGGVFEITDLAELDSPHDVISINAERAGRQAAVTIDTLVREVLAAGTSVQFVTQTVRTALTTANIVTGAVIKKMVTLLARRDVPTFSDGFYRAFLHPDVTYDLFTDTASGGWMDISKYENSVTLRNGEIGRYHRVRFLESSAAKVFVDGGATSADVYSTFFFGPDAYIMADSQRLSSYFVAAGGDHSDPLAQKYAMGWKARFGAALVVQAGPRYLRLESGATLGT